MNTPASTAFAPAATEDTPTGPPRVGEDELMRTHLHLAENAAWSFRAPGRDLDDLRQIARLGLLKAVRGFDDARGPGFAAYAGPTIRGELKRYLRDVTWVVRPPRQIQELRSAIERAAPTLTQHLGHHPTADDFAAALQQSPAAVTEALAVGTNLHPDSLDAPGDGGDGVGLRALSDMLPDDTADLDDSDNRLVLRAALRKVAEADRRLLFYRYFAEESQQEIAERFGMTQRQVSRALARILLQLHAILAEPPAQASA